MRILVSRALLQGTHKFKEDDNQMYGFQNEFENLY